MKHTHYETEYGTEQKFPKETTCKVCILSQFAIPIFPKHINYNFTDRYILFRTVACTSCPSDDECSIALSMSGKANPHIMHS